MCGSRSCRADTPDGAPIMENLRPLVHRKQHNLAQVLLPGQQHDDAVNTRRNAAVRWRAQRERAQHAAELCSSAPSS